MEITFLGYVSFILTVIILILKKPVGFLYAAIFFMGFSGSSVINVSGFSLQPSYYFFAIYFAFEVVKSIIHGRIEIYLPKTFLIFFLYCCVSAVFPLLLQNRDIVVMNVDGEYVNLTFTSSNITQLMYLAVCVCFINSLYKIDDGAVKEYMYEAFKLGFLAVILICLYQLVAFEFDLEFDYFFRQSVHGNVQGTRLYGPCMEASMLCYYLLPCCVMVFINRKWIGDWLLAAAGAVICLLTYSSTFVFGAVLILFVYIVATLLNGQIKLPKRIIYVVGVLVVLLAAVIFNFDYIKELFVSLIDKLNGTSFSGAERTDAFTTMAMVGLKYPFGVGFGSSRSKDLFSTWLCNIGVVGLILFGVFIVKYIIDCDKQRTLKYASPFLLVLVLMMISVPEPFNLFVWYFMWYGARGTLEQRGIDIQNYGRIDCYNKL